MSQEITLRIIVEGPSDKAIAQLPADEFTEVKGKEQTLSQKLRFALRREHLDNGGSDATFEPYYAQQMDIFITHVGARRRKTDKA